MKMRSVLCSAGALAALAGSIQASVTHVGAPQVGPDVFGGYASDHVMVRVKAGVAPVGDAGLMGLASIDQVMVKYGATSVTPVIGYPVGDKDLARKLGLDRWYNVNVPQGSNVRGLMGELKQFSNTFEIVELDGIGGVATVPNDPEFVKCWGQNNTGQSTPCGGTGTPNADVNAVEAWDYWTGDSDITLAVIDSGVTAHVDFTGKMVPGWDTVNNQGTNLDDSACPHGTHCAGTAAALGDNGVGVAGMSWGAKIMPVRVLTGCGGVEQDCGEGIMWAADNGANVGTMSLQYYTGSQFFEDAVKYGYEKGMVLIAANGNGAGATIAFPAKYPMCMGVGATTITDGIAGFSNTGPECDVSAPGQDVWSTIGSNSYSCLSGTSMATPHTSGLACLLWSYNPGLSNQEVLDAIINGVDDKGTPGKDNQFGWGRINALTTLQDNEPGVSVVLTQAVPKLVAPGQGVSIGVKISVGPDTLIPGSEKLFYRTDGGTFTSIALEHVSGQQYQANLPAFDCGDVPEFYMQAEGEISGVKTTPKAAPAVLYTYEVGTIQSTVSFDEGFNNGMPAGWSATGLWHVTTSCNVNPSCNGGSFAYYGQDNKCNYDTGAKNEGKLTSPSVNLTQGGSLEFCYRYDGEGGKPYDKASVLVDGKEIWAATTNTLNWTTVSLPLASGGPSSAKIEFVFNTLDAVNNTGLGFQVDGVKVIASKVVCDDACYPDCDASGALDIDDFVCFQTFFALGDLYADCDGSGGLDIDDFICFQTSFAIGC